MQMQRQEIWEDLHEDSGCILILFCTNVLSIICSQYILYYHYITVVITIEVIL